MRSFLSWLLGVDSSVLGPDAELGFRFNQSVEGWLVFLLVVGVLAFTIWVYRRDGRETARPLFRAFLGALRVLVIAIALLMLAEPVLLSSHTQTKPSTVLVLVDNSFSMSLRFPYAEEELREQVKRALGPGYQVSVAKEGEAPVKVPVEKLELKHFGHISRMEVVCQALRKGSPNFIEELGQKHEQVKLYLFGKGLSTKDRDEKPLAVDGERNFEPSGQETRIGDCLRQALKELRGVPLAGVVLITDGRQNGGEDPVHVAKTQYAVQRVPIFTVAVGDPGEPRDIEVVPDGPEAILPDDPTEVIAYVRQKGYDQLPPIRVELKEGDELIASETVKLGKSGEKLAVPLKFRKEKAGKYTFRIVIPEQEGELRSENNEAIYNVEVVDKKVKVLFVEGQDLPRWEYRYLKNALLRDHTTEADILLASSEGTWTWDGSPGKSPLETFPNDKKEIGQYDVIILGDLNPVIFTKDQMKLMQDFVREGGGMILIAGERYMPSVYTSGMLAEMLPVVPHPMGFQAPPEGFQDQFPLELTPEGKRMPWTQLDPEASSHRETWDNLPRQMWFYPVKRAKEIATVVAVHPFAKDEKGENKMPLIVVMPYGSGRTMFLGVDSLWRWRRGVGDRYHYRFYSQAIRYLSMAKRLGGQKRFVLDTDRQAYAIGDKVVISALVKDERFNPLQAEKVTVYVLNSKGKQQTVELDRIQGRDGAYEGHFFPTQRDSYALWMKDDRQPDARQSEINIKVDVPQLELENPRMNEELLKSVALAGGDGGEYVTIDRLSEIPPKITPKEEKVLHEVPINLWDNWLVMLLFTLFITAEWILRKRGRMI